MAQLRFPQASLARVRVGHVLRVRDCFTCGMCRRNYKAFADADACVGRCSGQLANEEVIVLHARGGAAAHRCTLCGRDYGKIQSARKCAQECKARISSERAVNGNRQVPHALVPVPPARPEQVVFFKMRLEVRANSKSNIMTLLSKRKQRAEQEANEATTTAAEDDNKKGGIGELTGDAGDDGHATAMESDADRAKKKAGDPFHRDGARYVCNFCSKDYFTKIEVMQCWDQH